MKKAEEKSFQTSDGVGLFYRHWKAKSKKALVLFHRGHEHSGRLQHIVDELDVGDINVFAWDARGHGKSPGERGYSPSVGRSVQDIDEFIKHISQNYDIASEDMIIIAQSISAVLASAWVHDYSPKIRGMILASPAFEVKLYVPFAREAIALWQKVFGKVFYINSYVKAKFLSHDPKRIESYDKDPFISKAIASNMLLGLYSLGKRIVSDARAIKVPLQMFVSTSDFVVKQKPQHKFYQNLGSSIKEKHVLKGFFHDTLGEKDRKQVFDKMGEFITFLYSQPIVLHDYEHEDRWSDCADEFRRLQTPPDVLCAKGMFYKIYKKMIFSVGRCSDGVKLGIKSGFNSGSTLDYIYQNRACGTSWLGRLFDRIYLDSPGWVGIRQRKINLESMIRTAIDELKQKNMPVRIMDIAAGHGRYILDVTKELEGIESVILRDYDEANVKNGQKLIKQYKLDNKVSFVKADAFDAGELSSTKPQATLIIVSGLYELFSENRLIKQSLSGVASAVEKGGFIIYTAQPWHPQLEMIARTLTDHKDKNKAWVMRARAQGEMDYLVEQAGFAKKVQTIDENGMFSVSIAEKK